MGSSKLTEEAVEHWGEGHAFANGASRLTGTTLCQSTSEILRRFIRQPIARTGEMWKADLKSDPELSRKRHSVALPTQSA
jgi:hypothetical protein